MAQLFAVDDFDGSVGCVRNEHPTAGLVNVPVVEAAGSSVSWKRNLRYELERH